MKSIYILYTGLCFFIFVQANAQTDLPEKSTYLELSPGLTYHQVKDDAMSFVRYQGVLPTLSFGIWKEKSDRKLIEWYLPLQFATIRSNNAKGYLPMKATMFRFDLDYVHLRKIFREKELGNKAFYLGASQHTFLDIRYAPQLDNSAIVYDNFHSLGISGAFLRTFQIGNKKVKHYHRISIPVLSFGTRPDYMNTFDLIEPGGNNPIKDAYQRASFHSFGSFQRIIIRNSLFYPIRATNQLGLTYEWQAYSAAFTVPIKAASHTLRFSLLVNL
ncbi:hypothetical protein GXP67_28265 [Rhodocytophaga rosea]|uniref:DUF2490 domain-containing protein n=1 Tax=Rhodocytophaga rosea TaxID=2704465 RepID=A0A6C0GQB7_9BACT|nr:hypothetical protein [Rhodocytophaga rosea]QHT70268.1 hypothetical protein GXP67_28265 [Rhodocytophaga rosea]